MSSSPNLVRARSSSSPDDERKFHIYQGHYKVSSVENAVFSTILGSCVAVCMHDPVACVGGMNHFLVPGGGGSGERSLSHGAYSMELLINGMLKRGADRKRLVAKLFGGGAVMSGLSDVGQKNAAFARNFLANEDILCIGESLGGESARRVNFWPYSGRARQLLIPIDEAPLSEEVEQQPEAPQAPVSNDVELF